MAQIVPMQTVDSSHPAGTVSCNSGWNSSTQLLSSNREICEAVGADMPSRFFKTMWFSYTIPFSALSMVWSTKPDTTAPLPGSAGPSPSGC